MMFGKYEWNEFWKTLSTMGCKGFTKCGGFTKEEVSSKFNKRVRLKTNELNEGESELPQGTKGTVEHVGINEETGEFCVNVEWEDSFYRVQMSKSAGIAVRTKFSKSEYGRLLEEIMDEEPVGVCREVRVRLITDQFHEAGIPKGTVGKVITFVVQWGLPGGGSITTDVPIDLSLDPFIASPEVDAPWLERVIYEDDDVF